MARGQRDQTKEDYWRQHVVAWRRSGLGVRAYCAAEDLSEPSFYAWRRVLDQRERHGEAVGKRTMNHADSPFVPLRIVEEPPPAAGVEVVLRGGRVVRVAAGFSADTLRAVVSALEGLPC